MGRWDITAGLYVLTIVVLLLSACEQTLLPFQVATTVATDEITATVASRPTVTRKPSATTAPSGKELPVPSTPPAPDKLQTGATWTRLDTTGGGVQTGIATHPTRADVVYMVSDNGGVFKTESGGDTWFSISSNLGAYRLGMVILDPLDPKVIYVTASTDYGPKTRGGGSGELYRSRNDGLSWELVSDAMGFQSSNPSQESIVIPYDANDPGRYDRDNDSLSDVIVVGAWTGPADPPVGGIWRSSNEGESFAHLALKDENITALRGTSGKTDLLYAATFAGKIYRSKDMGITWSDTTQNLLLEHASDLAVHPSDPDILYVTSQWRRSGTPPVWRTIDGGQNWRPFSAGLPKKTDAGYPKILIDRSDPSTLYVTTDGARMHRGGVYQSVNGGRRWRAMPARLTLPDGRPYYWYQFEGQLAIAQAIDGTLYAGGGGGWRYPDGDPMDGRKEWEPATVGVGNVHVNSIAVDPLKENLLYQGISDFGPFKSADRGASFYRILGNGWPVTTSNYVWNGPYYSNYQKCELACSSTCTDEGKIASGGTTDFAISRQDPNVVYSSFGSGSNQSQYGGVNKSIDGGKTWRPVGLQLEKGFDLNPEACVPYGFRHLAIAPQDDNVVFAAMEIPDSGTGKLYRTTDGGATWSEVFAGPGYITGLEVAPGDEQDTLVVVFTTERDVYKSEHGGEAGLWQTITPARGGRIETVALSPHRAQLYIIGTRNQGIWYTVDGGVSWTNYDMEGFFAQLESQTSSHPLDADIATAFNPTIQPRKDISAIEFDPLLDDTLYVGGTQRPRASFGVARVTIGRNGRTGGKWERLPLEGLTHRNVYDLAIDASGVYLYAGTNDGTFRIQLREP